MRPRTLLALVVVGVLAIAGGWYFGTAEKPSGQQTYNKWFDTCTLLTNGTRSGCSGPDAPITWMQLAPNQFRTASTYFPNIRNDWKPQVNMSVFKEIPIKERRPKWSCLYPVFQYP